MTFYSLCYTPFFMVKSSLLLTLLHRRYDFQLFLNIQTKIYREKFTPLLAELKVCDFLVVNKVALNFKILERLTVWFLLWVFADASWPYFLTQLLDIAVLAHRWCLGQVFICQDIALDVIFPEIIGQELSPILSILTRKVADRRNCHYIVIEWLLIG